MENTYHSGLFYFLLKNFTSEFSTHCLGANPTARVSAFGGCCCVQSWLSVTYTGCFVVLESLLSTAFINVPWMPLNAWPMFSFCVSIVIYTLVNTVLVSLRNTLGALCSTKLNYTRKIGQSWRLKIYQSTVIKFELSRRSNLTNQLCLYKCLL